MPTDYLLSERVFLSKALLQETEKSETYGEYNKHLKKNDEIKTLLFGNLFSIVDDILAKGNAIVIPSQLRASIKKRLHSAHLGFELEAVFSWPGIYGPWY